MERGGILILAYPDDSNDLTFPSLREVLQSKHFSGQGIYIECALDVDPQKVHPITFESLDANIICPAALQISGSSGPSALDTH